jgi:AAA family ATP:ADP antiporter
VLAFGGVVGRLNRRKFIPVAYLFVIAGLLVFAGFLMWDTATGGGFIGSDTETAFAQGIAYTFYVWLSVINLFITSVFWAFMVDIFNLDQAKRMFAFIAIGGTFGALVGSSATTAIGLTTQSDYLWPVLMLVSAALFGAAIMVVLALDRKAMASDYSRLSATGGPNVPINDVAAGNGVSTAGGPPSLPAGDVATEERIGGSFWEGAKAVATSPYMLGIGLWIMLMAISQTLIYFIQANIVFAGSDSPFEMLAAFGGLDAAANLATLLTQIFITTRLIKRLGVGWTLAILPLITLAGFAILAIWPFYATLAIFQAMHRATRYAISRPARETLWSVVTPAEKYKAKPVVDVFLYRFGDLAGVGIDGLLARLGMALGLVVAATAPLAALWCFLSVTLGRAQLRRTALEEIPTPGAEGPTVQR